MQDFFQYESSRISYQTYGQGVPVVLLHGFAEDGSVWQYQIDYLKDYCQIIVPEWWQVVNEKQADDELWTIDRFADYIAAFIKHSTSLPVILLGHSMGGYITLAVAEKYPQLLKGFGLVHSTAFADTEEKKATRKKSIEFIRSNGSAAFLKTSVPNLFGDTYKQEHKAEMEGLIAKGDLFPIKTMVACCEAMMLRPDRTNILRGSEIPILFILGEEDKAVPMADVLQQVHLAKTSYFRFLQNVGHMGMWEAASKTNEFILTYVQGIENDG